MSFPEILRLYEDRDRYSPDVVSVGLALTSYNEDAVFDIRNLFFNEYRFHQYSFDHGAQFFYVICNYDLGLCYLILRGTDGFDFFGRFRSWVTDCRILTGSDGVQNGFQSYGDRCFDSVKTILEDFDIIFIGCHSQGSGYGQYVARLCCDNLSLKHVRCNFLAYPPCFNKVGVVPFNAYVDSGKISVNLLSTVGDPLTRSTFRNENSIFLDGVDVAGNKIFLPDVFRIDDGDERLWKKIVSMVNHSPSQYLAAYTLWRIQEHFIQADLKFLAAMNEWIVN